MATGWMDRYCTPQGGGTTQSDNAKYGWTPPNVGAGRKVNNTPKPGASATLMSDYRRQSNPSISGTTGQQ